MCDDVTLRGDSDDEEEEEDDEDIRALQEEIRWVAVVVGSGTCGPLMYVG